MTKQRFALGGGTKRRQNWTQADPTLPVNRPVLWTSAAVAFSIVAVSFIASLSKLTSASTESWTLQSSVFNQTFAEFEASEPATMSVRSVAPTIFVRPAETTASAGAELATAAAAATVAQAPDERIAAKTDPVETWPRAMASVEPVEAWPRTAARTDPVESPPRKADPVESSPRKAVASSSAAPTGCLPAALRTVLIDLEKRFGKVTIVSTTTLHTDNHSRGSIRANLHSACKAVDIKTPREPKDVIAYLRTRPEVGGINTYRNRVIHLDLNPNYKQTAGSQKRRTARQ
jgi:hypothetical protein